MNKPSDYKVVRTKSPPMYFESLSDAIDNAELGIEDTRIISLYSEPIIPKPEPTTEVEIEQRLKELEDEIIALTYKIVGAPSGAIFNPFSSS